jgi:hypothetical protein
MPPKNKIIQPINAPFEDLAKAIVTDPLVADVNKFLAKSKKNREGMGAASNQLEMELIRFDGQNTPVDLNFDWSHETVWATRQQIALLFDSDADTIGEHISSIYDSGELDREATTGFFPVVRLEGSRQVSRELEHYNLDVILSVGYRVSSARATEFRKWATKTLRQYITDGFALNESRLRSDPHALRELAAKVRALRADEKNIYQGVRDVFAFGSSDYNKDAQIVRSFYAKVQDKFLYAVTGKTAAEIKLQRADHKKPAMGLTSIKGILPERADADVGKNYLHEQELYSLHILCEQFLLFVESKAIRGQKLTMAELSAKFDELLKFQGHAVFSGYQEYLAQKAQSHAQKEFDLWRERVKELPRDQKRLA